MVICLLCLSFKLYVFYLFFIFLRENLDKTQKFKIIIFQAWKRLSHLKIWSRLIFFSLCLLLIGKKKKKNHICKITCIDLSCQPHWQSGLLFSNNWTGSGVAQLVEGSFMLSTYAPCFSVLTSRRRGKDCRVSTNDRLDVADSLFRTPKVSRCFKVHPGNVAWTFPVWWRCCIYRGLA